jgi:hypothetical protein
LLIGLGRLVPLAVLLATFVAGGLFGALLSAGFYRVILGQRRLAFGPSPNYILLTGVAPVRKA